MTAAETMPRRAFAVLWKDFSYWQVRSVRLALTNKCYWPTVRLGDVVKIRLDVVPETELESGQVNMLDRVSFDEGKIHSGKRVKTKMVQFRAKAGDLVVSKINACKRAIGIVHDEKDIGITIHFRALIPDSTKVDTEFLWAALRSQFCLTQFEIETGGIGKGEISEEKLLEIKIPLPLMSEQKAIVARWREAQKQIAAARARVEKLEQELPQLIYRALGTPPPLAEKSAEKCFAVWWKDLTRWSMNYLSRARRGLLGFSKSKFPIVPLGEHLTETMNGYCIKPVQIPTPHKMLKLNALAPGGLDLTLSKFIKIPEKIAERFSIRKDDLFICRSVGSYDHVAKCALAKETASNVVFPDTMIRVRFKDSLLPEFVGEVIQTSLGRSFFQSNARTAVGMWKIGADDILAFPIPVPPLPVQREIMARVASGRVAIAREREAAARLAVEIDAEIEARILGAKK